MPIKLIVGLRNPGDKYSKTRHNAGGWFVEQLANDFNASFKHDKKLNSEVAVIEVNNEPIRLLLPLTYMNNSGLPIISACNYYKIQLPELLVAHDELDLPPGKIKAKLGGGHGGHNGLRSIITALSANNFQRLRIGIGHPGHKDDVTNYVLGKPSVADLEKIELAISKALANINTIASGDINALMNVLNGD